MVENGPTVQDSGTTAPRATTALGWMLTPRHRRIRRLGFRGGSGFTHARHNRAGERSLAGHLAVHRGLGFHAPQAALEGQHVHLDTQLISRSHRAAELGPLDAGKYRQLGFAVGDFAHHDDGAGLGHRLDHQHAGHDRIAGKVALKKRLVHGHVLDRDQPLAALKLDHSVDQQKRVAVGEQTQDLLDVECHASLRGAGA